MSILTNAIRPTTKSPTKLRELTEIPTGDLPYVSGRPSRVCDKCGSIRYDCSRTSHPILTTMCASCKAVFNEAKRIRLDKNKSLTEKNPLDNISKS